MLIGLGLPVSGAWARPDLLRRFAVRAEELGYHSVWTFQRLLGDAEEPVPPVYQSVLDPMLALTFAAAHTTRIRLGVAVINLPFVSPTYLAKQAATLDVLSGGRLDLGLGIGHAAVEFTATGATTERRGARTEEYLAALRTLWADEVSRFDGEFYTIPPSRQHPKPVQQPGPPILLGGAAPAALRRAGRLADGWVSRSATDLTTIDKDIAVVKAAARAAGRDPESLRFVSRGALRVGDPAAGTERQPLSGRYDQIRADLDRLGEQGVTELFYDLNWDPLIGSPYVPLESAVARATEIIEALAP